MNFLSIASSLTLLAGGSIDGDKRPLDSSEIWGVLVAGLGVVMAVLALLVIIIFLFGKIFDIINQKAAQAKSADAANQAPKVSAPRSVPAAAPAPAVPAATDDDEVIAVISAAIAMMSEADGKTYQVRSIKPAAGGLGGRTAWAMDGRRQNVMPF